MTIVYWRIGSILDLLRRKYDIVVILKMLGRFIFNLRNSHFNHQLKIMLKIDQNYFMNLIVIVIVDFIIYKSM